VKLSLDDDPHIYRIKSYTEDEITIVNPKQSWPENIAQLSEEEQLRHVYTRARQSFVMYPEQLLSQWAPSQLEELEAGHIREILQASPELILLGTGKTLCFPESDVCADVYEARVGLEIMDSHAACRTYNILAGEGRQVALALIMP
jgi:uncharacterized protein